MTLTLYLATALALLFLAHACVTRLSRAMALVLLLLPLVFTGRALLTGRVYAPVELTYTSEPLWAYRAELSVPEPHNPMLSDIAFQMIPWREAVRRAVTSGEWPLLNRFEGCGDVLAGETQPATFSPFTLIAVLLPAAASFGFTASIASSSPPSARFCSLANCVAARWRRSSARPSSRSPRLSLCRSSGRSALAGRSFRSS